MHPLLYLTLDIVNLCQHVAEIYKWCEPKTVVAMPKNPSVLGIAVLAVSCIILTSMVLRNPHTPDLPLGARQFQVDPLAAEIVETKVTLFTRFGSTHLGTVTATIHQVLLQQQSIATFLPGLELNVLTDKNISHQLTSALQSWSMPVHKDLTNDNLFPKFKLWSLTQYELVCYADADVVFFSDRILKEISTCNQALLYSSTASVCGFEKGCEIGHTGTSTNRKQWGAPYMKASFLCLRPDTELYTRLLQSSDPMDDEEYAINRFFRDQIYYLDCDLKIQQDVVQSNDNLLRWHKRVSGTSELRILNRLESIKLTQNLD
jgi:hypothetical protein